LPTLNIVRADEKAKLVPDIAILQALNDNSGIIETAMEQLESELNRKFSPTHFCSFSLVSFSSCDCGVLSSRLRVDNGIKEGQEKRWQGRQSGVICLAMSVGMQPCCITHSQSVRASLRVATNSAPETEASSYFCSQQDHAAGRGGDMGRGRGVSTGRGS